MTQQEFDIVVSYIFPIRNIIDFNFPDYSGLPSRVSDRLSSEAVDALQIVLSGKYSRKSTFSSAYNKRLAELGELIDKRRGKRKAGSAHK